MNSFVVCITVQVSFQITAMEKDQIKYVSWKGSEASYHMP